MPKRMQKEASTTDAAKQYPAAIPMRGRLFISWSGGQSKKVAEALKGWLSEVIEGVEPWISTQDITAGIRWGTEIDKQLQASNFGVICLTPDNLQAPWILFEAGALAKAVDVSRVVPYLFRVPGSDLKPPLAQFNFVAADDEGTYRLVRSINEQFGNRYDEVRLGRKFEKYWPDLQQALAAIPGRSDSSMHRKDRELLEELLQIARRQGVAESAPRNPDSLSHHIVQLAISLQRRGLFDSGYDLVYYMGRLSIEEAQKMGDNTLYAYWRSVLCKIGELDDQDDEEGIVECNLYSKLERELRNELHNRVMANLGDYVHPFKNR